MLLYSGNSPERHHNRTLEKCRRSNSRLDNRFNQLFFKIKANYCAVGKTIILFSQFFIKSLDHPLSHPPPNTPPVPLPPAGDLDPPRQSFPTLPRTPSRPPSLYSPPNVSIPGRLRAIRSKSKSEMKTGNVRRASSG